MLILSVRSDQPYLAMITNNTFHVSITEYYLIKYMNNRVKTLDLIELYMIYFGDLLHLTLQSKYYDFHFFLYSTHRVLLL